MFRLMRLERLKVTERLGRRGLVLIIAGLSWIGIGLALLLGPQMDRFSSPGNGTDTVLQLLDSHWWGLLWGVSGFVALLVGVFRDRRLVSHHDAIGFNAILTPPLIWMLLFLWSYLVYLATHHQEGRGTGLYGVLVYALISLFIMVIAGWPEPHTATLLNGPPSIGDSDDKETV